MGYRDVVAAMKRPDWVGALSCALDVVNADGRRIGSLVPVGEWILTDPDKIEAIRDWRQRSMRMFLTQFQSTTERTVGYLRNLSIAQEGRLFFLLYDEHGMFVGHMGMAGIDGDSGELDNLMRGVAGGDPRLVYFAEVTLLDWCFRTLGLARSDVRVISYNWLVVALHEEVGYQVAEQMPLFKRSQDGMVFHDPVAADQANVKYTGTRMVLERADFYGRAEWLVPPV